VWCKDLAMNWGEADVLDASPLAELELLLRTRDVTCDLVDAQIAAAVARAREAGIGWGSIAAALRAGAGQQVTPSDAYPNSGRLRLRAKASMPDWIESSTS
jgi:hypothetical protein